MVVVVVMMMMMMVVVVVVDPDPCYCKNGYSVQSVHNSPSVLPQIHVTHETFFETLNMFKGTFTTVGRSKNVINSPDR